MNQSITNLDISESPKLSLRMLNHWDNPNVKSDENVFKEGAIFNKWDSIVHYKNMYIDYSRILASVGINGTVVNNVNTAKHGLEGWKLLTPEYLPKIILIPG